MTKDELELEVKRLEKIVKDQEHLPAAINAKDAEIIHNKQEYERGLANLTLMKDTVYKELKDKCDKLSQDFEEKLDLRIREVNKEHKSALDKLIQEKENIIKTLETRVEQLNECLTMHGDLLKTMESVTNTHLTLNRKFVEGLK
jgi:vacuolar-type H+-ATPase subunit I/STV1